MKRREFFKRALAPLAAAVGLKPGVLPAMSTDTAPGFVSEYFPALPAGSNNIRDVDAPGIVWHGEEVEV